MNKIHFSFLADRTDGRAIGTVLRPSPASVVVVVVFKAQYTPPTPMRLNCRVELSRLCVRARRLS